MSSGADICKDKTRQLPKKLTKFLDLKSFTTKKKSN